MRSFIEELDIEDYGNIKLTIKECCKAKGIEKTQFVSALNCGFTVGSRYYENKCKKVDLDVLSRVLYVLECDKIDEILSFTKTSEK